MAEFTSGVTICSADGRSLCPTQKLCDFWVPRVSGTGLRCFSAAARVDAGLLISTAEPGVKQASALGRVCGAVRSLRGPTRLPELRGRGKFAWAGWSGRHLHRPIELSRLQQPEEGAVCVAPVHKEGNEAWSQGTRHHPSLWVPARLLPAPGSGFCFLCHGHGSANALSLLLAHRRPHCQVHMFAGCQAAVCTLP